MDFGRQLSQTDDGTVSLCPVKRNRFLIRENPTAARRGPQFAIGRFRIGIGHESTNQHESCYNDLLRSCSPLFLDRKIFGVEDLPDLDGVSFFGGAVLHELHQFVFRLRLTANSRRALLRFDERASVTVALPFENDKRAPCGQRMETVQRQNV
jgi:hypothetical protein